jgi:hypothetical protein
MPLSSREERETANQEAKRDARQGGKTKAHRHPL